MRKSRFQSKDFYHSKRRFQNTTSYGHQECRRDHHDESTVWEHYEKVYAKKSDNLLDKKKKPLLKKNYGSQARRNIVSARKDSVAGQVNRMERWHTGQPGCWGRQQLQTGEQRP